MQLISRIMNLPGRKEVFALLGVAYLFVCYAFYISQQPGSQGYEKLEATFFSIPVIILSTMFVVIKRVLKGKFQKTHA